MSHIMPSIHQRRYKVDFKMPPSASRHVRDDETSVMETFCKHISTCRYCDFQCFTSSKPLIANSLCNRGIHYARDVSKYLYHRKGIPYSTCERTKDGVPFRVEVPSEYKYARRLLQAVEYGLELQVPIASSQEQIAHEQQRWITRNQEQQQEARTSSAQFQRDGVVFRGPMTIHIHVGNGKLSF